jgi:hypothetical protein
LTPSSSLSPNNDVTVEANARLPRWFARNVRLNRLIFPHFSSSNRWGKNKHKIPREEKRKVKREKLLNSNSGEEDKKTKRLKNKPNKNKPNKNKPYLSLMAG